MRDRTIAAVVGGFLGSVTGLSLSAILAATSLERDHPATARTLSELAIVICLLIGTAAGLIVFDRQKRPPTGLETDYNDPPSAD